MWTSTTYLWDRFHQKKYIHEYSIIFNLDKNPHNFHDHLVKVCKSNPGIEKDILGLYHLLRMYGLLYDKQTVYQIETLHSDDIDEAHTYDPKFDERWQLFKHHNDPDGRASVPELMSIVIEEDDLPYLPKQKLRYQGRLKIMKNHFQADEVWDETSLSQFRKNYGNVDLLSPFKERPKRRYEGAWNPNWNK